MIDDVRFYGYKHWTLEETPRCFYVGKGRQKRPFSSARWRSAKWRAVVARLGLRVEVCVGPVTDREAIAWEVENIKFEGTFTTSYSTNEGTDIGCNFTLGGDGASGYVFTSEALAKLSGANNHQYGKPSANKGKSFRMQPEDTAKGVAVRRANGTYAHTQQTKKKLHQAHANMSAETRTAWSNKRKTTLAAQRSRGELKKSPEEITRRIATQMAKSPEVRRAETEARKATRKATMDARRVNGVIPRTEAEVVKRRATNDAKRSRGEPLRSETSIAKQRATYTKKRFRRMAHIWFTQ